MIEEWKPIARYEGVYEISSAGRVKRLAGHHGRRERILRPKVVSNGYHGQTLSKEGVKWQCLVHRLVAEAFIGPIPDGAHINHLNGITSDNRPENLEITTPAGNTRHAIETGLRDFSGENHWASKLTHEAVIEIKRLRGVIPVVELAQRFGVCPTTISRAQRGKTWK